METSWLILEEDGKSHAPNEASAGRSKISLLKSTGLWNVIIYKIHRQNFSNFVRLPETAAFDSSFLPMNSSLGPSAMHRFTEGARA
ncbi:hypothetical protein ACOJBM_39410 [Rhizobium beringeri]|uniref:hypothetical protein n=1 Tax=Rhizobium beringeri TaxID=3019934 RepID=UPI003B5BDE15